MNGPQKADLVFEGGGVKGIGLIGALAVLQERGWQPASIAGTSAGAITAAALAAGYGSEELKAILLELDFASFKDEGVEDKLPFVAKPASLLRDLGIYEGVVFEEFMRDLLAKKNVHTFADLQVDPEFADDPRWRSRLQVIVSDVTKRRLLILPRDAHELGIEPDDLEVAKAVRMSMSIPVFFEPVRWKNPVSKETHLIVDGGMLSNFPVWLFDCDPGDEPEWPTFGLLLVEPQRAAVTPETAVQEDTRGPGAVLDFVKALANTMMQAHDRMYVEHADYARTIPIPTLGVGTTEFDLSRERSLALYESGRKAAGKFLDSWDFDAYVAEFARRGRESSRRHALVAQMQAGQREAGTPEPD